MMIMIPSQCNFSEISYGKAVVVYLKWSQYSWHVKARAPA